MRTIASLKLVSETPEHIDEIRAYLDEKYVAAPTSKIICTEGHCHQYVAILRAPIREEAGGSA